MTFSSIKTKIAVLLTFITVISLSAQTYNGKIITTKGGEAVPFANIMVKSTSTGTPSDQDGKFVLTIPEGQENGILVISAVGYTNKEIAISQLNTNEINIITITPVEYKIDEVDVQAESKILYGAIKKCSQSISENYITTPYTCAFTYKNNDQVAQGTISDSKGYKRTSFRGSLRQVSYTFDGNDTNDNIPYFEGKTNMEDLLSFDLMRTVGNIIDEQNVYDFDLEHIEKTTEKDTWVIHFSTDNPKINITGDAHATAYEGELYIKKSNFAITKIVIRGKSAKRSIHGKAVIVGENSTTSLSDVSYEVTTTYKDVDGKYRLDLVSMRESFTNAQGQKEEVNSSLEIGDQMPEYEKITGRDYFVKSW